MRRICFFLLTCRFNIAVSHDLADPLKSQAVLVDEGANIEYELDPVRCLGKFCKAMSEETRFVMGASRGSIHR